MAKRFPIKYWLTDNGLTLIGVYAREGLTQEQLAKRMGCSLSTLKKYFNDYPKLREEFDKWAELADGQVEKSLFDTCFEKEVPNTRFYKIKKPVFDEKGELVVDKKGAAVYEEELIEKEEIQTIPPNTNSMQFWLKNRKPKKWDDKQRILDEAKVRGINITIGAGNLDLGE